MNILVTCDDGWGAPGLSALAAEAARLGTVRAAVPERPSSGSGHAVTLHSPVSARPATMPGCEAASVIGGTPADAVKLALAGLWPSWRADLVLSGINPGPNVGVNVFYSGTVGAAAEAAVVGVSAVAVSLDVSSPYDFAAAAARARPVLGRLASLLPFPPGIFFNVNLPRGELGEPLGVRLTRHGASGFREFYRPCPPPGGAAGSGVSCFLVDGEMTVRDPDDWTDAAALAAGHISVTPMLLDLTADGLRSRPAAQSAEVAAHLARLADWGRGREE